MKGSKYVSIRIETNLNTEEDIVQLIQTVSDYSIEQSMLVNDLHGRTIKTVYKMKNKIVGADRMQG